MENQQPGYGDDAELTADFERNRDRLHHLARRILGDSGEADEIVQEAWLRLLRARPDDMRNLNAWLTTVATRLCLDAIRARARHNRGRVPIDTTLLEVADDTVPTPEEQVMLIFSKN